MKIVLTGDELMQVIIDRVLQVVLLKIEETMSTQVDSLKADFAAFKADVLKAVDNGAKLKLLVNDLKTQLADKTTALAAAQDAVASLTASLAAAQAAATDPADVAALTSLATELAALKQSLADSNAITDPAN